MHSDLSQELRLKIDDEIQRFAQSFYKKSIENPLFDESISDALQYVLSGKGKRVRGVLCMLTAHSLKASLQDALPSAIALELVHAYSLVHDDLPMIDNDDFRRGMPTVHKKYDEPTALLVGDGLLTDAFTVLADQRRLFGSELPDSALVKATSELAQAAGSRGMVLGQHLDILHTGKKAPELELVKRIHLLKTGKLMGAACALGAIVALSPDPVTAKMRRFGELLGLTFQIRDDLIDSSAGTGKTPGKDLSLGKSTFVQIAAKQKIEDIIATLTTEAFSLLEDCCPKNHDLKEFFKALIHRQS